MDAILYQPKFLYTALLVSVALSKTERNLGGRSVAHMKEIITYSVFKEPKKHLLLLISGGIRPKCDLRSSPQFSRLKLCQTRYVRAVIFQAGLRKNKAGTSL